MHRKQLLALLILAAVVLVLAGSVSTAHAQDWSFTISRYEVDVWINRDGSVSLEYYWTFTPDPRAHAIDAVDVGLPTGDYRISDIRADVDGKPINRIDTDYQGEGDYGVAVWLGSSTIRPGQTGTVHVVVDRVGGMLYGDDQDTNYASTNFIPVTFGFGVHGTTAMTVRFHLPKGVQTTEPRWHQSPSGWPSEPVSYHDNEERIVYEWSKADAEPGRAYTFGASFPRKYVDEAAIQQAPSFLAGLLSGLAGFCLNPVVIVFAIVLVIIVLSLRGQAGRRMKYLPPAMKVEGVGIKRGLTAVEAAIVLETPLNKVLTMILFGLIKKGAVTVLDDNPLRVQKNEPLPAELRDYETEFLAAVAGNGTLKEKELRKMMIDLVKVVHGKMKGFSWKETVAYYNDIVRRAWQQVEGAETPEMRGELFGEGLEWTMLDDDFQQRTERTFREGPVFVPIWWGHYRPWGKTLPSGPAPVSTGGAPSAGPVRMPTLPGSTFAASIVRGIEGTAGRIVGSLTGFTGSVTQVTNPPPKTSSWSGSSRGGGGGGGGCACACACACAGCACACAGGGR